MITEDYCSPEVERLLEEKEFDSWQGNEGDVDGSRYCTHALAMKWMREKRIIITVNIAIDYVNPVYWGEITDLDNLTDGRYMLRCSPTYEQAVEAALKLALENLI